MEGRLILDVIVGKCATTLELFTSVKVSHCYESLNANLRLVLLTRVSM